MKNDIVDRTLQLSFEAFSPLDAMCLCQASTRWDRQTGDVGLAPQGVLKVDKKE